MSQSDIFEDYMHRFRQMASVLLPNHTLNDREVLQMMQRFQTLSLLEPETISVQMPEGIVSFVLRRKADLFRP